MTSNTPNNKSLAQKKDILIDRSTMAYYFNLARHNLYTIVVDLEKILIEGKFGNRSNIKERATESQIKGSYIFKPNKINKHSLLSIQRMQKRMQRYLPFIVSYEFEMKLLGILGTEDDTVKSRSKKTPDASKSGYVERQESQNEIMQSNVSNSILVDCIESIHELRNFFSHAVATHDNWEAVVHHNSIIQLLDELTTKKEGEKMNRTMKKIRYRFKHWEKKTILNADLGKIELYRNNRLTQYGLLYFLTLFLERQDANKLISSISGFKRNEDERYRVKREYFMQYCCRKPKHKLDSQDTKQAVVLDLLGELHRCPRELYDRISLKDQKKFNRPAELADDMEVKMLRHDDRFNYFILRYFDLHATHKQEKDESWGYFPIRLGKVRTFENFKFQGVYERSEKKEDLERLTRKQDRIKELHAFGPLHLLKEELNKDNSQEIEHTSPSYLMLGNRIGVRFKRTYISSIKTKEENEDCINRSFTNPQAELSLHTNDLPHMLLCHLSGQNPFDLMKEYKNNFLDSLNYLKEYQGRGQEGLEAFCMRFNLKKKAVNQDSTNNYFLPEKVIAYIINASINKVEDNNPALVDDLLKDNAHMEHLLASEEIRLGEIIQWLAKDINRTMYYYKKDVMPEVRKLNRLQYMELQANLLNYPRLGARLFHNVKCLMLNTDKQKEHNLHPFLFNIEKERSLPNDLFEFLGSYLQHRKAYLEGFRKKLAKGKTPQGFELRVKQSFKTKTNKVTTAEIDTYIEEVKKHPVKLPAGFFLDHLRGSLSKEEVELFQKEKNKQQVGAKWITLTELTRLVAHKKKEGDNYMNAQSIPHLHVQKMYDLNRNYYLPERDEKIEKNNSSQGFYLSNLKLKRDPEFKKCVLQPESRINQLKLQDYLCFMMMQKLLADGNMNIEAGSFSLANTPYPCEMRVFSKEEGNQRNKLLKNEIDLSFRLSKVDEKGQEHAYTITAKVCGDRYGDFRHLLKDTRLLEQKDKDSAITGVLPLLYKNNSKVDWEELREILIKFESKRILLIEQVFTIEKELHERFPSKMIEDKKTLGKHISFIDYLKYSCHGLSDENQSILKEIRNGCLHNRIPMVSCLLPANTSTKLELFGNYLKNAERFMKELKLKETN